MLYNGVLEPLFCWLKIHRFHLSNSAGDLFGMVKSVK